MTMPPMEHFQKKKNDPTVWDFQRSGSDPDVGFPEASRQKQYHSTGARQSHTQKTEEERLNWNRECYLND